MQVLSSQATMTVRLCSQPKGCMADDKLHLWIAYGAEHKSHLDTEDISAAKHEPGWYELG